MFDWKLYLLMVCVIMGTLGGVGTCLTDSIRAAPKAHYQLREKELFIMSVLQAILLGLVQGITEFLPVSSFGHTAAIENAMGITRNTAVLFEALLHIGTLVAVIVAFWDDLRRIGEEALGILMDIIGNINIYFHNRSTGDNLLYARVVYGTYRKFTVVMAVSFIPTALLGYICRRLVTRAAISPLLPGACILITGVFLLVTDLSNIGGNKTPKDVTYDNAMWIGICQGISVFPGISRCGMTICAGLLCGFSRKFAVKYSYLISIPAILGSFFLEASQFTTPKMTVSLGFTYVLGMIVAGVTGYFMIRVLLQMVQRAKLRYFAFYCFVAGAIALICNFA